MPGGNVVGGVGAASRRPPPPERCEVGPRDVGDVHEVAGLAAVLEDLRRLAALERGAEQRRDAGVRGVPRHPGAVDVVVAQRHRRGAGLAHPRRGVVLLGDLAGGVDVRGSSRASSSTSAQSAGGRSAGSGCRSRRPRARRPRAAAAPGRRARGTRSGPRRRPPSRRPAPAGRHPPRASRPAARRCRGRCGRRTRAGRPTCTPAPTIAAWWQTTSTPRSRSTQAAASRTSSCWVPAGGAAEPCAIGSMRSTRTTS